MVLTEWSVLTDWSAFTDWSVLKYCSILTEFWDIETIHLVWKVIVVGGWYLDYSVSSGPFKRFSMRFEFLSKIWVSLRDIWPFSMWDQGPELDKCPFHKLSTIPTLVKNNSTTGTERWHYNIVIQFSIII